MPRLATRSGRSRLPILLGGLLLAVAVLALAAFYLLPRPSMPDATLAPSSAAGSASSSTSGSPTTAGEAPTGCLGGQQRDSSMVLAAQREAPHTAYGAVEVAAALFRWGLRYPYPSAADVRAIRPVLAPQTAAKQEADWDRAYSGPYQSPVAQETAEGTPYYVTTANGDWLIPSGSTANSVSVELEAHPVVGGSYSTATVTLQVDLLWSDGTWRLRNLAKADGQSLANGGTSFTSGC